MPWAVLRHFNTASALKKLRVNRGRGKWGDVDSKQASNHQGPVRGNTSARMEMEWSEAAERVGWWHTLDSTVKEGLSEEATLMEELILWGNGKAHFRSGYSKFKGPELGRQGAGHDCHVALARSLDFIECLGKQRQDEI